MSKEEIKYPFRPKSNRFLREGQFWAIPLSDGRFACGYILKPQAYGDKDRMGVVVGLMDWVGGHQPTVDDLTDRPLLAKAKSNFQTITNTGGEILGALPLKQDGSRTYKEDYSVGSTVRVWGWQTIKNIAEKHFQVT